MRNRNVEYFKQAILGDMGWCGVMLGRISLRFFCYHSIKSTPSAYYEKKISVNTNTFQENNKPILLLMEYSKTNATIIGTMETKHFLIIRGK